MIRVLCLILTLGYVSPLAPAALLAETGSVTIADIVAKALTESSTVREIEARIAEKKASGISIGTLENPKLESEVLFPTSYRETRGSTEVNVALNQPFRPSDFGVRTRVNSLIQNAAGTEQKIELLGFSQRLRLAYVKAWALERRAAELGKYSARASDLEKGMKRASESGYVAAGEGHLLRAEALKARFQLAAISSDLSRARAELSKVAGFAVEGELTKPALSVIPSVEELLSPAGEISPQARAALAVKLASEQQRLAELDAYPKFAPRLVYERTDDFSDYVGFGISVDLPFFDRNQGERMARSAELAFEKRKQAYFEGKGYEREITALRESVAASTALLAGYETEILPALRRATTAEEKLLASGQGSLFRVWQTLKELAAAESETVERTVKAYSDRAELVVLTGTEF